MSSKHRRNSTGLREPKQIIILQNYGFLPI